MDNVSNDNSKTDSIETVCARVLAYLCVNKVYLFDSRKKLKHPSRGNEHTQSPTHTVAVFTVVLDHGHDLDPHQQQLCDPLFPVGD